MASDRDLQREIRKLGYSLRESEILAAPPTGFELFMVEKYLGPFEPDPPTHTPSGYESFEYVAVVYEAAERIAEILIDGAPQAE